MQFQASGAANAKGCRLSLKRAEDCSIVKGDDGRGPKIVGRDMMGNEARQIRGSRTMENRVCRVPEASEGIRREASCGLETG